MCFGAKKPLKKDLNLYSKWCQDLNFDEKEKIWYLQWQTQSIRSYYLNFLLVHEVGHFVESVSERFWSKSNGQKRENFADNFARIWYLKCRETIEIV